MNLEKNSVNKYIIYYIRLLFNMKFVKHGQIEVTLSIQAAIPFVLLPGTPEQCQK